LRPDDAFAVALKLVTFEEDMQDRVQPKLIWHQIEPFIVDDPDLSWQLLITSKSRMLRQNIVRRLACDPEKQVENLDFLVGRLVRSANRLPNADILTGIKAAIEGRKQMKAPKLWSELAGDSERMDAESADETCLRQGN